MGAYIYEREQTIMNIARNIYQINRFPSGELAQLVPLDNSFVWTDSLFHNVVSVCNEPLVYQVLFAQMLQELPYQQSNAEWWANWAREGWDQGTHSVWALMKDSVIFGAIDLKNIQGTEAEVGFWCSVHEPGYMTNTLNQVLEIARESGLKTIYAWVRPGNKRSGKLLLRSGFAFKGLRPYESTAFPDTEAEYYEIQL